MMNSMTQMAKSELEEKLMISLNDNIMNLQVKYISGENYLFEFWYKRSVLHLMDSGS